MTGSHNLFRLYAPVICHPPPPAQRNVEALDFVPAVSHSNHHTVGAASWQNHDSSIPQSVFILHSSVWLGLSNPYISSALWKQRKSKNTAHYIPILLRGLGEAVVTNDWCIIYSLWCTSHEHLVHSHPKNICWYIVQPISRHIPTPSLVSPSDLSIILLDESFFSLESHLTGEPCVIFVRNYVLACMFCIVWCQQISIWSNQIESSIYFIKRVWFLKNLMIREGAGNTENLDFKLRDHRDPFHRNKRMGTHWEGLNIFSYAKILCAKLWP